MGETIRALRQKKGITQGDLAARLEILQLRFNQPKIAEIENGRRAVWDYELVFLARALDVSIAEFAQHLEAAVKKAWKTR